MESPFFKLTRIDVSAGTEREPHAEVEVFHFKSESARVEQATGDGPVDALYNAIDLAVGSPHKVLSYSIRSVSEGSDALGEATVLLNYGNVAFRGVARDSDVLQASAKAYMEALNKLETFRSNQENEVFVRGGIMDSFHASDEE
jgi:2-isopropylmalate synthase